MGLVSNEPGVDVFLMNAEKLRIGAALIAEVDLELVEETARDAAAWADAANNHFEHPDRLLQVARAAVPVQELMLSYQKGETDG